MKKNLFFLFLSLFFFVKSQLLAQTITMKADDLSTALCHKWEAEYALVGGMKMGKAPGATDMVLEFKKDNSLIMTSAKDNSKAEGKWKYDAGKKQVLLTINGQSRGSIIAVKDNEITMLMDTKEATPDDPTSLQVVFKIKGD